MNIIEALGFVTGAACVYLVVKRSIWNFSWGLASNVFFAILFHQGQLYWDMALQGVFFVMGVLGWLWWANVPEEDRQKREVPIRCATSGVLALCIVLVACAAPLMMTISQAVGGAAPFWDSLTTALSLIAQWMLNRRLYQTWFFWIAADLIYIPLYASREWYLTSFLYAIFLCLCIAGLSAWRRELSAHTEVEGEAVV